ncbi:MAG: LysR family transcriptional regulator [Eubacterium sp.]|nr:LysR family transcriptional regulator [Eubacterium sp.]
MEIRVLQYFLAIAREQSIVKAAQSLHLSQPTLSTQIRNLEEKLGKQLLIRGSKGSRRVTLTEEGMILRKRAEEILDLVQKTENEITLSDSVILGDVFIGAGETDGIRILARAAKGIQAKYPGIRYHLSSGNAAFVTEQLDKGLIDFGVIFGPPDLKKYEALKMPFKDSWGVLMRSDAPLAEKASICPEELWDKPLIISHQESNGGIVSQWIKRDFEILNIVSVYNLIFNASLFVEEGLGYAICFDKIINTADSRLCFRPLNPPLEIEMYLIWKKYQVFSKAAKQFLQALQENIGA